MCGRINLAKAMDIYASSLLDGMAREMLLNMRHVRQCYDKQATQKVILILTGIANDSRHLLIYSIL